MTSTAATLEWLLSASPGDSGIDRKALAGLLAELAQNVEPELRGQPAGVLPIDPRLEQLRRLLLGREIAELNRLTELLGSPEQLAAAVAKILPTAIAESSQDARLGQVLAPVVEKATQTSIRNNPRNLINILYPLIVPAIRKSIRETIDETFQSLNESLSHIFTWRGLKWRWEGWQSGTSFAAVVLRHSLVFQVEHVFLIHQHTGLLIAHVAAEHAESQDPQLVSSMLVAIQDFVKDSFSGAENQGLDTLRLGELTVWSEPGPFATLVTVIRGNPPEGLHETLRGVLSQIHAERGQALEGFDGDSTGFTDIEAQLSACVALRQEAPRPARRGFPWLVVTIGMALVLVAGVLGYRWWQNDRQWDEYAAMLRAEPGIIVTEAGWDDGKYLVEGLRDPLAADPALILRQMKLNPTRLIAHWAPYEGLDPQFVLMRLQASLDPPPTVTLMISGDHIVAEGSASTIWLQHARTAARIVLPVGAPALDLSNVRDVTNGELGKLRAEIQAQVVRFDYNASQPSPGQEATLDQLALELKSLTSLSATLRVITQVTITGHSDATGQGGSNLFMSQARAEAVRTLLVQRGVDPELLNVRGAGPLEPLEAETSEAARSANRRVSFAVDIED